MIKQSNKIITVFCIAFFIKILLIFLNNSHSFEVFEYEVITNNILRGKGFLYYFLGVPYRAYVQPFYPVFTAIVYYLTNHSHIIMGIIQSLISSLLCFIIYTIAIKFTDKKGAFLAAALTAFHPGLTVYSVLKLHPLVFDTFFYLLTISLIFRFVCLPTNKNAILTGVSIGLSLLSRSTILPFVILCLIYIFLNQRNLKILIRLKYLFIICFFALIIYSPWIIRNYKIFHKFVLIPTSSGENLWAGNNPYASGSVLLKSGISVYKTMPEKMQQKLSRLDELGQVEYFNNYFLNFVKSKPILFVKLFLRKFYYFWWFSPQTGIWYPRSWLYIYKIYYGVVALSFLFGLFITLKNKTNYRLIFVLFVYMFSLSLIHSLVNIDTRHRWTIEPIIITFASIGILNTFYYFKGHLKNVKE